MANFIVPEKIQGLVASRVQTWGNADAATGVAAQLDSFSKDASLTAAPAAIPETLSDGSPPEELSAAVQKVKEELSAIANYNKEISAAKTQIKTINAQVAEELRRKKNMRLILICAGVGVAIIAVVLFVIMIMGLVIRK